MIEKQLFGVKCKMKTNSSNAVNVQWECDSDAMTSQRIPKSLYSSAIDCLYTAVMCVTWGRCLRSYGAVMAIPLCFYCVLIRTQSHGEYFVHIYSLHHRMTFIDFRGDLTATNENAVALTLLRVPWCFTVYILYSLGSPRWRSSDVTGFNKYLVSVLAELSLSFSFITINSKKKPLGVTFIYYFLFND